MASHPPVQAAAAELKRGASTLALFELLNAMVGVLVQHPGTRPQDKLDLVKLLDEGAKSVGLTRSQGQWVSIESLNLSPQ